MALLSLDRSLVVQTALFYLLVLLGLLVAAPVALTANNFQGFCILFANVRHDRIQFGSSANCNYIIYSHIVLSVLYSSAMASIHTYTSYQTGRGQDVSVIRNVTSNLVSLVLHLLILLLSLVCSVLLSCGFAEWCLSLTQNAFFVHHYRMKRCSEAQYLRWESVDGSTFYQYMMTSLSASWICSLFWLFHVLINIYLHFKLPRNSDTGRTSLMAGSPEHECHVTAERYVEEIERY